MWTKVLALQKCMVYIGLFHPCEHRANISDKDQGIELAFSIALADPNFLTTQRLSAFAQCPQLPEASRRSTGVNDWILINYLRNLTLMDSHNCLFLQVFYYPW